MQDVFLYRHLQISLGLIGTPDPIEKKINQLVVIFPASKDIVFAERRSGEILPQVLETVIKIDQN